MGRILALDFGLKRVGAAISDPTRTFASPLEIYERRRDELDAAHYRAIVQDERIERIIVGLPIHTTGHESDLSIRARAWGKWLAEVCGVLVVFHDERYTSAEAEAMLQEAGLTKKRRKARLDMLAAQILLQAYLEAGCPVQEQPARPLDDAAET